MTDIGTDYRTECDFPYATLDSHGECRCIICTRCERHTGNARQGHYWSWCAITKADQGFHFCCPDDCELHPAEVAVDQ